MAEARVHGDFKLVTEGSAVGWIGHNVILPCHLSPETSASSMTIRWFKESECIYLYKNGQVIEGRGYKVKLTLNVQDLKKGNVSLTLRDYRMREDDGVYICQVKHGEQEEEIAVGLTHLADAKALVKAGAEAKAEAKAYLRKETAEQKNKKNNSAHVLDLQVSTELERSNKLLTKKGHKLDESNKLLTKKGQEFDEINKLLTKKGQESDESNKLLTKKGQEFDESNKLLTKKGQELDESNKLLTKKGQELDESNKLLTEKGQELDESNKLLTKKGQELDESNKLLTTKDQQLNQKAEELKTRKREWDDVITENKQLAQQICDLKTELEKLRTESDKKTESGFTSTAGPKLPIRRWSINIPPEKDGENTDSTLPLRRSHSMGYLPPDLGGETTDENSSLPVRKRRRSKDRAPDMAADNIIDSPVSLSVSELRLVLLGRTVAVRNAVGNTILGRKVFGAEASSSELSQRSRRREGDVCGRRLVLVDTPDFSGRSLEDTRQDVGLCVRLSAPGPHAFLLVIPAEASEGEVRGMMEKMQEAFGESCWEHSIAIIIHADSVKKQNVEEFLQAGSQEHQQLVEKCGNRCHVLNITDSSNAGQVSQLLEKIESMVARNTESFYSTQTYQEAEAQVREMERKIQRDLEERRHMEEQEMRERFEKELKDSLRKIEGSIQEHEGDIRKIDHRTSELERQMREERDEEKKRELEGELRRESERREEMERKLDRFRAKRDNERREREERHTQDIEEMRETYEAEARVEAERNLMKVLLPEIQNIMISNTKMQREFNRQLGEKNREMTTLRQTLKESHSRYSMLEELYQDSLDKRLKVLGTLPSGSEREYL